MRAQRNVKYLIMALLFACVNEAFAYIVIVDDVYYDYVPEGDYVSVVKRYDAGTNTLRPYSGFVTIPSSVEVKGKSVSVKYIATDAFQGCTSLLGVSLPNTIVKINSRAFFGCTGLTYVDIPQSVTEIGQAAFYGCTSLEEVDGLGNSKVTNIDANAFCQCGSLQSISFPNTLETIGNSAFENATSGTISISFPQSLKRIGDKAFSGVSLSSLHIPKNVVSIGSRAFDTYGCSTITVDAANNVYDSRENCNAIVDKWNGILLFACNYTTIPHGLTGIASYAFNHCMSLSSINIPQSVTTIGSYAFDGCFNLKSVKIFGAVTELQEGCFESCPITELVLPTTLKKIGPSALNSLMVESLVLPSGLYFIGDNAINSASIKNITLPSTVSYIGSRAITIAYAATFTMEGDVPGYVAEDAFGTITSTYNPLDKHTLKVKNDYLSDYQSGHPWNRFHEIQTITEGGYTEPEIGDVEEVTDVELVDGQAYDATGYRRASTLTYTRDFVNTFWQALYVPFSMSYDDWKDNYDVARLNAVRMYDTDDDGEYDETELEIIKVKSGYIYANHPYFIKAKNAGKQTITLVDALVYPAESNSIDCSTVETHFKLTGIYNVVPGNEMVANRYYALSRGQFCYTTNVNAYLNPNRWYMKITERGSQVYQKTALARMRVSVKGEENDEVLEDVTPNSELFDGDFFTATGICISPEVDEQDDAPVFTLEGMRVNTENVLRPGIYIKNGKKYIVK